MMRSYRMDITQSGSRWEVFAVLTKSQLKASKCEKISMAINWSTLDIYSSELERRFEQYPVYRLLQGLTTLFFHQRASPLKFQMLLIRSFHLQPQKITEPFHIFHSQPHVVTMNTTLVCLLAN